MRLDGKVAEELFGSINLSVAVTVKCKPSVVTSRRCPCNEFFMTISTHVKVDSVIGISQGKAIPSNIYHYWSGVDATTARV